MNARTVCAVSAILMACLAAAPSAAAGTEESGPGPISTAPNAREVQSSVEAYLAADRSEAPLVGGPGSAGYDHGFWIRGGSSLLRLNLTLQARYEAFLWSDSSIEPSPGGDLSGFSLPRATLKLSGDASCNVHYYAQLEFGHAAAVSTMPMEPGMPMGSEPGMVEFMHDPGILREGWIEYEASRRLAIRAGLVPTAATRQLMVAPEMQQFVDVSLAAASVGSMMPGWTDRNRDYGLMAHGAFGCDDAVSWMATVTNGDGGPKRNVLDPTTNDNLAYGGRINWEVLGRTGYTECAIDHPECGWRLALGAWGHYYAAVVSDRPHVTAGNMWTVGVDAAGGYGGFSFCAAFSYGETKGGDPGFDDVASTCWCVQAGYLFPGTNWEVAARYSSILMEMRGAMDMDEGAHEIGVAVNYFVDGHANKVTADASFIFADEDGNVFGDVYPGYQPTATDDGVLLRLQWQLAL